MLLTASFSTFPTLNSQREPRGQWKQMSSLGAALSLTLSLCASLKGPFMVNCSLATSEHDVEIHQHDKTEPLGHGKVATAWGARLAGALHKSSGNGHAFVPLYSGGNDLVNAWHLPFPPVPPLTPRLTLSQEIFVRRWPFRMRKSLTRLRMDLFRRGQSVLGSGENEAALSTLTID